MAPDALSRRLEARRLKRMRPRPWQLLRLEPLGSVSGALRHLFLLVEGAWFLAESDFCGVSEVFLWHLRARVPRLRLYIASWPKCCRRGSKGGVLGAS